MALASPLLRRQRIASVAGAFMPGPVAVHRCHPSSHFGCSSACLPQSPARTATGRAAHSLTSSRLAATAASDYQTTTSASITIDASELDVGYSSVQGVRDTMEDEVQVHFNPQGHYLYAAVFDGHGGDQAVQWLARELHGQVESCLVGRTLFGGGAAGAGSGPSSSSASPSPSPSSSGSSNGGSGSSCSTSSKHHHATAGASSSGGKSGTTSSRNTTNAANNNNNGTSSSSPPSSGSSSNLGISTREIVPQRLIDSFHTADRQLLSYLEASGGEEAAQSGSTATVVVIKDDKLVVANVGDSQAVLSRKGTAVTLAHSHRVYGSGPDVAAEIERVKSVGGWVDDGRVCGVLAVSRAFGDWDFKGAGLQRLLEMGVERGFWDSSFASQQRFSADPVVATPDVTETILSSDDEFLIVASDGLWDVLPPREAVQWARKEFKAKKDASQVAASLAGLALKRYSTDNVAVVVVDLQGAEARTAAKTVGGSRGQQG
ncbi:hypothetical protein Agub_g2304, partial [Astrephomene gubernaculifera]